MVLLASSCAAPSGAPAAVRLGDKALVDVELQLYLLPRTDPHESWQDTVTAHGMVPSDFQQAVAAAGDPAYLGGDDVSGARSELGHVVVWGVAVGWEWIVGLGVVSAGATYQAVQVRSQYDGVRFGVNADPWALGGMAADRGMRPTDVAVDLWGPMSGWLLESVGIDDHTRDIDLTQDQILEEEEEAREPLRVVFVDIDEETAAFSSILPSVLDGEPVGPPTSPRFRELVARVQYSLNHRRPTAVVWDMHFTARDNDPASLLTDALARAPFPVAVADASEYPDSVSNPPEPRIYRSQDYLFGQPVVLLTTFMGTSVGAAPFLDLRQHPPLQEPLSVAGYAAHLVSARQLPSTHALAEASRLGHCLARPVSYGRKAVQAIPFEFDDMGGVVTVSAAAILDEDAFALAAVDGALVIVGRTASINGIVDRWEYFDDGVQHPGPLAHAWLMQRLHEDGAAQCGAR